MVARVVLKLRKLFDIKKKYKKGKIICLQSTKRSLIIMAEHKQKTKSSNTFQVINKTLGLFLYLIVGTSFSSLKVLPIA